MKSMRFIFALCVVAATTFFIYSCAKDGAESVSKNKNTIVESRSSSACTPSSMFSEYSNCVENTITTQITFGGPSLYNTNSLIASICPDLEVTVTYKIRRCDVIGSTQKIHFIYDLEYDLADMIAACPDLGQEIDNQNILGNLVEFLDAIDHEVSAQTEYNQSYLDAQQIPPLVPFCSQTQRYTISYIRNTCYQWVPYTGNTERPVPAYRKEECGASVCCVRATAYCNNGTILEPNLVYSQRGYISFEGECPEECTHKCLGPSEFGAE
jgi:hypothetical protein